MRKALTTLSMLLLISINSIAQTDKPVIADDLLKDKDSVKATFFPMVNNRYLYAVYSMAPDTFIAKLNKFKAYYNTQINQDKDDKLKDLKRKDIEYYCRYMIHRDYLPAYGRDSIKTQDFDKFRTAAQNETDYKYLMDSAYKATFIKTLSPQERARLEYVCWNDPDLDDTGLFKHSRAYRDWLSDYYMFVIRPTKYKALPGRGGYLGNPAGMLTVINNEVKSTFIREYYASRMVSAIIKQEKKPDIKEKAYRDFMAVVTNRYYKEQVTTVYENYKRMVTSETAPDFTYTDINNQPVSLKGLRGKYVYIDVWATWCTPCKAGLPFLSAIEKDYHGKNIQFVSISVDRWTDRQKWVNYVKTHQLPGIQLLADSDFSSAFINAFNINSIPRCIIIGPEGKIVTGDASDPTNPQLRKELDSLLGMNKYRHYNELANSKNSADHMVLLQQLYQSLTSGREEDWMLLPGCFRLLKRSATADSVEKAQKIKFPEGIMVRDEQAKIIYAEKDAAKMEGLYKAWITRFPPERFEACKEQYEYVRSALSYTYAKENNVAKAMYYADTFEIYYYQGSEWARTADELLRSNHLAEAALLYKKARDTAFKYKTNNYGERYGNVAASGFVRFSNSLAEVYFKQKKYKEALVYAQEADTVLNQPKGYMFPYYAKILIALSKNKEAFDRISVAVKEGQASSEMRESLEMLYVKIKGSHTGYTEYVASLNNSLADQTRDEIAKTMIDLVAPDFTLKDVDGQPVSLTSLKGKVVVLDFWAIWCVPCKASLPAMRLAVKRYSDDPNVKFLFIHTWENHHKTTKPDDNPAVTAKNYVTANNYPFQVLMDLKDPLTGKNKVVSSYGVVGIPTKFVIDKNGHIRFRLTGLPHGDDAGAEEVAAMIELAKNAE